MVAPMGNFIFDQLSFNEFYLNLVSEFECRGAFSEIKYPRNKINWGKGRGVYTIWHKSVAVENLLYIGMTGKLKRTSNEKIVYGKGNFKSRAQRWTPYRFCESKKDSHKFQQTFRFGPTFKSDAQSKHKFAETGYLNTFRYKELIIHQLSVTSEIQFTPSFIETLLLNKYYFERQNLPPANNEL